MKLAGWIKRKQIQRMLKTWDAEAYKVQVSNEKGRKDDSNKARWDLLPWQEVSEVVGVLTYGANKYGPSNWKYVPSPRERYLAATHRHLFAWWMGEKKDPETGCSHLAHAVCCLLFLMWFDGKEK